MVAFWGSEWICAHHIDMWVKLKTAGLKHTVGRERIKITKLGLICRPVFFLLLMLSLYLKKSYLLCTRLQVLRISRTGSNTFGKSYRSEQSTCVELWRNPSTSLKPPQLNTKAEGELKVDYCQAKKRKEISFMIMPRSISAEQNYMAWR